MSKEEVKKLIRNLYSFIGLLIAFASAVILWYWNVGAGWKKGLLWRQDTVNRWYHVLRGILRIFKNV